MRFARPRHVLCPTGLVEALVTNDSSRHALAAAPTKARLPGAPSSSRRSHMPIPVPVLVSWQVRHRDSNRGGGNVTPGVVLAIVTLCSYGQTWSAVVNGDR